MKLQDSGSTFIHASCLNGYGADDTAIECSEISYSDDGHKHIDGSDSGSCHTGGISIAGGWRPAVRRTRFSGIYCDNGACADPAILLAYGSRDSVIEQNLIENCAAAIHFGIDTLTDMRSYPDKPDPGGTIEHYGGIIRNNAIEAGEVFSTGISLWRAPGARVYHNSFIYLPAAVNDTSSVDYRFEETTGAEVRNNILRNVMERDGAAATVDHNLENPSLAVWVDAQGGDYHLGAGADSSSAREFITRFLQRRPRGRTGLPACRLAVHVGRCDQLPRGLPPPIHARAGRTSIACGACNLRLRRSAAMGIGWDVLSARLRSLDGTVDRSGLADNWGYHSFHWGDL